MKSQGELIKVPILVFSWQPVARCLGILREVILKSNLQFITVNSRRRVICRSSLEILPPLFPYTDWKIILGFGWRHISAGKSGCFSPGRTSHGDCALHGLLDLGFPLRQARMLEAGAPKSLKCFRFSVQWMTPMVSSIL